MEIRISQRLKDTQPDLNHILTEISCLARSLDRKIKSRDVLVKIRCDPHPENFVGTAWPMTYSVDRRKVVSHVNGKITMTLGYGCGTKETTILFAHELRHLGQFYRGRERYGILTTRPLAAWESEIDAYEFENKVWERMR